MGSFAVSPTSKSRHERALFEWHAVLYPMVALPAIRSHMHRLRREQAESNEGVGRQLRVNESFRQYVLAELHERDALPDNEPRKEVDA